jgi:hypothetical protein
MFRTSVVCFCDIPIGDLAFHARKYSDFGLAFRKEFLLAQGANLVFYVAEAELGEEPRSLAEHAFGDAGSRVALFRAGLQRFQTLFVELKCGRAPRGPNALAADAWPRTDEERLAVEGVFSFIGGHIGCFIKDFEPSKEEDDLENFYMEREWRVVGDVNFALDDVTRVFLPRSNFKRFRQDVPDYYGQVQEV